MCWYEIQLQPRDILFFRDAKPMEASSIGSGGNWPLPNVFHDALMHGLKKHWPERQSWEVEHRHKNSKDNRAAQELGSLRFGGLKTIGLFPAQGEEVFFPRPLDIDPSGRCMKPADLPAASNLPGFIEKVVAPPGQAVKQEPSPWLSSTDFAAYLNGEAVQCNEQPALLYDIESRPGIGLNPETGTADTGSEDEGGKLYIAEYLRLREGVTLRGFAKCESSLRGEVKADVLEALFKESERISLILGGQRGVAEMTATRNEKPFQGWIKGNQSDGCWVKWILLTPAVFPDGWRPNWVDHQGRVQIPSKRPPRQPGQTRTEWRNGFAAPPKAKLAAACTGKPVPLSGWNLRIGGPRPAKLAVPAGSVYWFRAESSADAARLAEILQGRCMSGLYGEKGFGLGICVQQKI